jgi:hypothetical protein
MRVQLPHPPKEEIMSTKAIWLLVVLLVGVYPLAASTYWVGTCHKGSFPTIMAAVTSSSVAPGSTINVCPGGYQEQVIISKPLTLEGVAANNSSQVVISAIANPAYTQSAVLETLFVPMVWVTAGPVNIQNISVVAVEGNDPCPSLPQIGFYYSSGASGKLNRVSFQGIFYPNDSACPGYGIWVENAFSNPTSVTISNSFSDTGILVAALEPLPDIRLTVSITGNQVLANVSGVYPAGIYVSQVGGTVSGNSIHPRREEASEPYFYYYGIWDDAPNAVISGNTIVADDVSTILSNNVEVGFGVGINVDNAVVKSNKITGTSYGIEFNCHSATVTGNVITAAIYAGLDQVPSSFTGVNTVYATGSQRVQDACP